MAEPRPNDPILFDLGRHMTDRVLVVVQDTLDTMSIARINRREAFRVVVCSLIMLAVRLVRSDDSVSKNEYLSLCAKLWSEADRR